MTDVSTTCAEAITNNRPSQDSNHPDDLFQLRYVTPGFKPFSYQFLCCLLESGVSDGQLHTCSSSECDPTICLTVKCSLKNEVCKRNSGAQMLCYV